MASQNVARMELKWNGKAFTKKLTRKMQTRLKRVVRDVANDIKQTLKVSGRAAGRSSQPGEPPMANTGALRRSIIHGLTERKPLEAFFGTSSQIGALMEMGGREMVMITPRNARALKIPVPDSLITEQRKSRTQKWYIRIRGSHRWYRAKTVRGQKFIFVRRVFRQPVKPRPFLFPALHRNRDMIVKTLTEPIK